MPPSLRCPTSISSTCTRQLLKPSSSSRSFSTTSRNEARITRARRQMFIWLASQGNVFRDPLPGSTNYLNAYNQQGQLKRVVEAARQKDEEKKQARKKAEAEGRVADIVPDDPSKKDPIPPETRSDLMPFPLNKHFISQPVLSEELREEVWKRIMVEGKSVRVVSAELGIEMNRVGAVVRLMEVEKEWKRVGKPLVRPYARAVMSMLPKTSFNENPKSQNTHEPINDLPIHPYTGQQIFHPTSESRHFTRADAAKAFNENLLPADDRVPHPELAEFHKDFKAGVPQDIRMERAQAREDAENNRVAKAAEREARREAAIKKVDTGRFEFRFTPINVDDVGKDGRGANGVGWRYGMPHMDRSRGAVKIPTSVG